MGMTQTPAAERRERILTALRDCKEPLSGSALARELGVTRQVIVQDVALLRRPGRDISTRKATCCPGRRWRAVRVISPAS